MIRTPHRAVVILSLAAVLTGCSKVTDVAITPVGAAVEKGTSTRLQARVTGEGNPDTTVRWTILEPVAAGTAIAADGMLTIASGEPASTLLLSATSAQDRGYADTVRIELSANKTRFWGRWQSVREGLRRTLTLTADTLRFSNPDGATYLLASLSWVPTRNEDPATKVEFTEGFLISGTFLNRARYGWRRADGTVSSSGVLESERLLISRDGQRMIRERLDGSRTEMIVWTRQPE